MRKLIFSCSLLLLTSACAYHAPTEPTTVTTAPAVTAGTPTILELAVLPSNGSATVTARVLDAQGAPVHDLVVSFTSDRGDLTPATASTDGSGRAMTTVTASAGSVIVSARAGALTRSTSVAIQNTSPTVPTPTPPPASPTPSPPTPEPPPLTVTIFVTPQIAGQATAFSLATQAITSATWTFGDGSTVTTGAPSTTHVYAAAGVYLVGVTVIDTRGRSASTSQTVTILAPPPPPGPAPPAAASLKIVVTCTPAPHGSLSHCNLTATDETGASVTTLYATPGNVKWDFGDGTADALSFGATMQHTYPQIGTYKVEATVFGPNGLIGRGSVDLAITQ